MEKKNKTEHLNRDPTEGLKDIKWYGCTSELMQLSYVDFLDKRSKAGEPYQVEFKASAFKIYLYLLAYKKWRAKYIFPNVDKIAEDCGISVRTVARQLNTLEEIGLIKRRKVWIKSKGQYSNRFIVYFPNAVDFRVWRKSGVDGKSVLDTGFFRYSWQNKEEQDKVGFAWLSKEEEKALHEENERMMND